MADRAKWATHRGDGGAKQTNKAMTRKIKKRLGGDDLDERRRGVWTRSSKRTLEHEAATVEIDENQTSAAAEAEIREVLGQTPALSSWLLQGHPGLSPLETTLWCLSAPYCRPVLPS